jgi:hypothetical protein
MIGQAPPASVVVEDGEGSTAVQRPDGRVQPSFELLEPGALLRRQAAVDGEPRV